MVFSSAFSFAFAHVGRYVAPMCAQESLAAGAAWAFDPVARRVSIGGRVLVGIAGTPYRFASVETAATWCAAGAAVVIGERATVASLAPEVAARYVVRRREKLRRRAALLVGHAAVQVDVGVQRALLEEAALCERKWS